MDPVHNNSNPDFENTTGHYCDNKNHALQKQPQKAVLKNFAIFTGKHLCWRLLLIKFRPATGL